VQRFVTCTIWFRVYNADFRSCPAPVCIGSTQRKALPVRSQNEETMSSNSNKKPSPTPDETPLAPTLEIVDPSETLDAEQIKHIEKVLEQARILHKEIEAEQAKTGVKIVWQGCHLHVVAEMLSAIEDMKIRTELFDKLLGKFGIAKSTARQRILLVKRMKQKRALSTRVLANAEESDKPSTETLALLDKACGNKLAVELQREYGIRQPLKDKEKTLSPAKSEVEKVEARAKVVQSMLEKIEKLAEGKIFDAPTKDRLNEAYRKINGAVIRLQKSVMEEATHAEVDPIALAAINPPADAVTA